MATRYDDIFGDVANFSVCCVRAGPGVSDTSVPLLMAVSPRSIVSASAKVALKAGSSKQGNARLASVDSNCVTAYFRLDALLRYRPRSRVFNTPANRTRISV